MEEEDQDRTELDGKPKGEGKGKVFPLKDVKVHKTTKAKTNVEKKEDEAQKKGEELIQIFNMLLDEKAEQIYHEEFLLSKVFPHLFPDSYGDFFRPESPILATKSGVESGFAHLVRCSRWIKNDKVTLNTFSLFHNFFLNNSQNHTVVENPFAADEEFSFFAYNYKQRMQQKQQVKICFDNSSGYYKDLDSIMKDLKDPKERQKVVNKFSRYL